LTATIRPDPVRLRTPNPARSKHRGNLASNDAILDSCPSIQPCDDPSDSQLDVCEESADPKLPSHLDDLKRVIAPNQTATLKTASKPQSGALLESNIPSPKRDHPHTQAAVSKPTIKTTAMNRRREEHSEPALGVNDEAVGEERNDIGRTRNDSTQQDTRAEKINQSESKWISNNDESDAVWTQPGVPSEGELERVRRNAGGTADPISRGGVRFIPGRKQNDEVKRMWLRTRKFWP